MPDLVVRRIPIHLKEKAFPRTLLKPAPDRRALLLRLESGGLWLRLKPARGLLFRSLTNRKAREKVAKKISEPAAESIFVVTTKSLRQRGRASGYENSLENQKFTITSVFCPNNEAGSVPVAIRGGH